MSNRFAGLDWASRTHAACVIDEHGSVHLQFESTTMPSAWPSCAVACAARA